MAHKITLPNLLIMILWIVTWLSFRLIKTKLNFQQNLNHPLIRLNKNVIFSSGVWLRERWAFFFVFFLLFCICVSMFRSFDDLLWCVFCGTFFKEINILKNIYYHYIKCDFHETPTSASFFVVIWHSCDIIESKHNKVPVTGEISILNWYLILNANINK